MKRAWGRSGGAALLLLGSAAGCAGAPGPSSELLHARSAVLRARSSPVAPLALAELQEAEALLAQAEREELARPSDPDARELAYLARRKAERARISGQYAADLHALENAKQTVARLRRNVERRRAAEEEQARALADADRAREERRAALASGLALAKGERGELVRDAAGATLRIPADLFFLRGEMKLSPEGLERVDAVAGALRAGPESRVTVRVDEDAKDAGDYVSLLGRRRAERVRAALIARGVPLDLIHVVWRRGTPASVAFVVTERDELAPQTGLAGDPPGE